MLSEQIHFNTNLGIFDKSCSPLRVEVLLLLLLTWALCYYMFFFSSSIYMNLSFRIDENHHFQLKWVHFMPVG